MNVNEGRRFWSDLAKSEVQAHTVRPPGGVSYHARNVLGWVLLQVARKRIISYGNADIPKETWLERAVQGTGRHVLDVGIRTGHIAQLLKRCGKSVYGIDVANEYVTHCRKTGAIDYGAMCDVEQDDIPVPAAFSPGLPDRYDAIIAGEIIEHLVDGRGFLMKLSGVCRPGGCLILTTPNLAYLGNRIRLLLGRDLHPLTIDRGIVGNQHIRVYTARLLRRLLGEASFNVVDVASDGLLLDLRRFIRVEYEIPRNGQECDATPSPMLITPVTGHVFPGLGRVLYLKAERVSRAE